MFHSPVKPLGPAVLLFLFIVGRFLITSSVSLGVELFRFPLHLVGAMVICIFHGMYPFLIYVGINIAVPALIFSICLVLALFIFLLLTHLCLKVHLKKFGEGVIRFTYLFIF